MPFDLVAAVPSLPYLVQVSVFDYLDYATAATILFAADGPTWSLAT